MRTTIIYLGVILSGILVFCSYAFLASLTWDDYFSNCLTSDTVITFFLATGWIMPALVGYELYRHLYRNEIRHAKRIKAVISSMEENTPEPEKSYVSVFSTQEHLN
ncbi:MAG TPA: hypothetical protein VG367_17665 [Mucilaginibacter sp.]|jgi:hypothetical protein|nr:hypothetical protein [Mucilaginibacter sp.]